MPRFAHAGAPAPPITAPRLRECADCGQRQMVPAPPPGVVASCLRCARVLRRGRADPLGRTLVLGLTGLVLLLIACLSDMMEVSTAGIDRGATLLSGPEGLEHDGLWELSLLVLFTTIGAPLLHLGGTTWVLLGIRLHRPPAHLRPLFAVLRRLRQWSMIEVYLVGLFVAYTKLRSLVQITIGPALWALLALMLVVIAADALLDPEAVWQRLEQRPPPDPAALADGIACHTCGAISPAGPRCERCNAALHRRKPDSIARTWALATAALVLYLPANIYPVLTYTQLGSGSPSTILGGARELLDAGQWPLALIVFLASVAVPVLKLAALFTMLVTTQLGLDARLHDRTVLYHVIEVIGRWSMIDIFMESILVALVQFGGLVTITPGVGALAFGAVVVLTMLAAEAFDPRLMWDRAGQ
jgi:paraquat-inducible protein A